MLLTGWRMHDFNNKAKNDQKVLKIYITKKNYFFLVHMYTMSSEPERLTKERKITEKKY